MFGAQACDVIVPNDGTLDELFGRLAALARFAGLVTNQTQDEGGK
jgi:hypothetical protein